MADSNWMERELCVMLWCHGWGLLPLFQNTPMSLLAWLRRDVHGKNTAQYRDCLAREWEAHQHPLVRGAGPCGAVLELLGPSGQLLQLCFYLLALRILVQFNKPTNTLIWCSVTTTAEWALALQDPCLDPHISVWGKALPQALTATLHTCSSTYLLVSNLITIQSRGKTLIFIRFRNTQKIFRRNSCHTGKKK